MRGVCGFRPHIATIRTQLVITGKIPPNSWLIGLASEGIRACNRHIIWCNSIDGNGDGGVGGITIFISNGVGKYIRALLPRLQCHNRWVGIVQLIGIATICRQRELTIGTVNRRSNCSTCNGSHWCSGYICPYVVSSCCTRYHRATSSCKGIARDLHHAFRNLVDIWIRSGNIIHNLNHQSACHSITTG